MRERGAIAIPFVYRPERQAISAIDASLALLWSSCHRIARLGCSARSLAAERLDAWLGSFKRYRSARSVDYNGSSPSHAIGIDDVITAAPGLNAVAMRYAIFVTCCKPR